MTDRLQNTEGHSSYQERQLKSKAQTYLFRAYEVLGEQGLSEADFLDAFQYTHEVTNHKAKERAEIVWRFGSTTTETIDELKAWVNLVANDNFQPLISRHRGKTFIETAPAPATRLLKDTIRLAEQSPERQGELLETIIDFLDSPGRPQGIQNLKGGFHTEAVSLIDSNWDTFKLCLLGGRFEDAVDTTTRFCVSYLRTVDFGARPSLHKAIKYMKDQPVDAASVYLFKAVLILLEQQDDTSEPERRGLARSDYLTAATHSMLRLLHFAGAEDGLKSQNAQQVLSILPYQGQSREMTVPFKAFSHIANGLTANINDQLRKHQVDEVNLLEPIPTATAEALPQALDRILYVIAQDADPTAANGEAGDVLQVVKAAIQKVIIEGIVKNRAAQPRVLGDVLVHFPFATAMQHRRMTEQFRLGKSLAEIEAWYWTQEPKARKRIIRSRHLPGRGLIS